MELFFQFYEMYRHQVSPQSSLKIGNRDFKLWKDFLVTEPVNANINADMLYAENAEPEDLQKLNIKGKVLVVNSSAKGIKQDMFLFQRRYPGFVKAKYYNTAFKLGAKAIIFITDDIAEKKLGRSISANDKRSVWS